MRLSTKGRFAVTAMIDIALREEMGPVPLTDIGPIDGITVADIIGAVEAEALLKEKPLGLAPMQDLTQDLWDAVNAKVLGFTQSVTLKSLVLAQLAMGIKIEHKSSPNRGVFKMPVRQSVLPNVPNSVFALGRTFRTR